VKDFSFENPNAPRSIGQALPGGGVQIEINVGGRPLSDSTYEVELVIEARAGDAATVVFNFELTYGGVFKVENIPQESVHPLVMIEGPRLLFPFARQILADATRNGGFPPLLLDPIDFAALYRQRLSEGQGAPQTQNA
jgi:preprotein translocase subunit SecB